MNILEIVGEFDRQKHELESLKTDPTHADLRQLDFIVAEIERGLLEVIREPWVPSNPTDIKVLLSRTNGNIQSVEQAIRDKIGSVDPNQPEHILRVNLSFSALAVLDYMMEMLIDAWAKTERPTMRAN